MDIFKKPYLFWDIDYKKTDLIKNKDFIVGRILSRGDVDDFRWAVKFYGNEEVRNIFLKKMSRLDAKSSNFFCVYFNIKKPECTPKQSIKKQSASWRI